MRERKARERRRAAATVEAVIALPVFVLVLIAAPYLHALLSNHQRAMASARESAWRSAVAGCADTDRKSLAAADVDAIQESGADYETGMFSSAASIPVVGDMIGSIVPKYHCATDTRSVARPKLLGDKPDMIEGSACFTCNEQSMDPEAILFDVAKVFGISLLW